MDTFSTIRLTKAFTAVIFVLASFATNAQVSPYAITPAWYAGHRVGLTFTNGNFPSSGAPTFFDVAATNGVYPEASTSISYRNGNVAMFTNTVAAYNGANTSIRSFAADNTCAGSATGGGVAFPDPARSNPLGTNTNDAFYLIIANDLTSGACANQGSNQYRFTGTGTGVVYNAGPTLFAPNAFASEAVTVGSDGTGGYWVVQHLKTNTNTFRKWHFLTDGSVVGPTDQTVAGAVADQSFGQAYLKISPCQNKIAYNSGIHLNVYDWDRTTGNIGAELLHLIPNNYGSGLEFSPDGNRIYYSHNGSIVSWSSIPAGSSGTVAGSAGWSLQMGPDGKIYTSPDGWFGTGTYGVISNANTAPTNASVALPANNFLYRGISNLAWLNPQNRSITQSGACAVTFGIDFKNYFNTQVTINTATIQWDFNGDGTWETAYNGQAAPTYDYAANGGSATYTVNVRFNDAYCGQQWTATTTVTASCPMPVEWLEVSADVVSDGVNISWATSAELNTSYFVVQRSENGSEFVNIGTTAAAGNSHTVREYSLKDLNPLVGASYYRIIQYDIDGKSTSSRIVAVNMNSINLKVYPNPSEGQFELELSGAGEAQLTVTDMLGRVVYTNTLQGEYVNARFGDDLDNGTYVLTVVTPSKTLHEKLIKE